MRFRLDNVQISHETIDQYIKKQSALGSDLYKNLRHKGKKYCTRKEKTSGRELIANRIDITKISMIVDEKSRIGDWVTDTIIEKNHQGAIVSLVDRRSQYVFLQKMETRKANEVKDCIIKCLRKRPLKYRQTITFKHGKEFSQHEILSKALKIKCYFAKPYASWERSLNEHTNGLSRQYLPKKTEFIDIEDDEILAIQKALNNRSRKVLNYRIPNEVMRRIEKPLGIALHG